VKLAGLVCVVLGHRFYVQRILDMRARKVGCRRCAGEWALHERLSVLIPWDEEFEAMYAPREQDRIA
jgi:hypothetical protein